jgi:hypothetical protein
MPKCKELISRGTTDKGRVFFLSKRAEGAFGRASRFFFSQLLGLSAPRRGQYFRAALLLFLPPIDGCWSGGGFGLIEAPTSLPCAPSLFFYETNWRLRDGEIERVKKKKKKEASMSKLNDGQVQLDRSLSPP